MGKKVDGQLGTVFATWISVIFILALVSFVIASTHLIGRVGESSASFNESSIKKQAVHLLNHTVIVEATRCAAAFQQAEALTVIMAQTAAFFIEQNDIYGNESFNLQAKLTLFPNKVYANSASEKVAVVYIGGDTISKEVATRIESLSHVDKLLSIVKDSSTHFAAAWIATNDGASRYYPNTHYVTGMPSIDEYDYLGDYFYSIATPEKNPDHKTVWTSVYKDIAGQGSIVSVTTPVYGTGGNFLGTAGIDITFDSMAKLLMSFQEEDGPFIRESNGFHFLVEKKGDLIALPENRFASFGFDRIDNKSRKYGDLISLNLKKSSNTDVQALFPEMIKRRSGITTINVSGVPFYVSYIPVSGTDWTLGLAIPEQELLASVGYVKGKIDSAVKTMSTRFVILTIAFLFLMILSTTLLFHRRLLSPLKKLIVYTKKIAEGNLEQQVEVEGPGEIGELAAAFNQMARDLFKTTVSRNILSSEISEREKVEAALRESEEKLRNIIENSSNLFYSHTSENVLTFLSPQTIKFLDCEPYECMEVWMNTVTDNPLNAIGYESTQRAIDTGERQPPFELELIGKKGRKIWVEVNEQPVVVDGKTVSIVGALTDITERKKEEQRRLLMEAQLQHSQKIESVGRLAGGIAHDFNNMLSVILGNVNLLLLTSHQGDKSNDYLTEIQTAAQHSAELTQQLLAFARKQPMVPQVLDLNDAVEDTLKILKRLIGENINLIWKPAIKIWPVMLDPSQINQILANLCLNARDAIEGSGEVVIQTENVSVGEQSGKDFQKIIPGDYVLLTLTDNGCGIDEVLSEKLFEPFFTTKDVGKGTGLGLSTIYGIIKQNKGFVSIKSERGKGTSFSIYFPRCTREELKLFREEQTRMSAIVPSEPVTDGGTDLRPPKQETILLVEDEPAILKMTTMVLQMEGFTVVSASAPSTAIELVKELSIQVDLLITDVIMPEMNGLDLSKVLQSIIPGLKVLYMSGYTADVINKEVVIDEGASFIQKPFDIDELVVVIRKVLDS